MVARALLRDEVLFWHMSGTSCHSTYNGKLNGCVMQGTTKGSLEQLTGSSDLTPLVSLLTKKVGCLYKQRHMGGDLRRYPM
jgi:hypothetical protein